LNRKALLQDVLLKKTYSYAGAIKGMQTSTNVVGDILPNDGIPPSAAARPRLGNLEACTTSLLGSIQPARMFQLMSRSADVQEKSI